MKTFSCELGDALSFVDEKPIKDPRGIILIIHGLNLKPEKMNPLAEIFSEQGFWVINAKLPGHRGIDGEMRVTKLVHYEKALREILCLSKTRAEELKLPLDFLGFSMGGILGINAVKLGANFRKMTLIAPPIKVKWWIQFLLALRGEWLFPSLSLSEYRANFGTGANSYHALKEFIARANYLLENGVFLKNDVLLIYDPEDITTDTKAIRELLKNLGIEWNLLEIQGVKESKHHLLIDSVMLPKSEWKRLKAALLEFYLPKKGD